MTSVHFASNLQSGRLRQAELTGAQFQILPGIRILEACSHQCDRRSLVAKKIKGDERLTHLHSTHAHIFHVLVRLVNIFNCVAKLIINVHV